MGISARRTSPWFILMYRRFNLKIKKIFVGMPGVLGWRVFIFYTQPAIGRTSATDKTDPLTLLCIFG